MLPIRRQVCSLRFRLCLAALLALWLGGQQLSAEHDLDHHQHDRDCAAWLAAAAPLAVAALSPPPVRVGGELPAPALSSAPRHSFIASVRNRGPPAAPQHG